MTLSLEERDNKIKALETQCGISFRQLFDATNDPCGNALDQLWRDIILSKYPDYGDWEYPGQAYRHLLAEYNDLRAENGVLKGRLSSQGDLLDYAMSLSSGDVNWNREEIEKELERLTREFVDDKEVTQ